MRFRPAVLRFCLLPALGLGAAAPARAQSDSTRILIVGTVVDPLRHPIEGAEVWIVGGTPRAMTTSEGTFRLYAPRTKEILVQVRRPGYNAQLLRLSDGWTGTILLQPGSFRLPEVQVTARYAKPVRYAGTTKYDDYFRRKRLGFGQFVGREEIDRRQPMTTVDLLAGQAGIRTSIQPPGMPGGTSVQFARCHGVPPKINVYVDGRRVYTRRPLGGAPSMNQGQQGNNAVAGMMELAASVGEALEQINPSDIELMEIYRGPGQLPAEFHDDNCGAIAIWTRWAGR